MTAMMTISTSPAPAAETPVASQAVSNATARPISIRKQRKRRGRERRLRERRLAPRLAVDEIVRDSNHLSHSDRALIAAVYERGLALKAVAVINHTQVGRLQRRLTRIVDRLRSPLFRMVLRDRARWPADRRAIADAVVLRGESQREIAELLGISVHVVRMELEHLKAMAEVVGV